MEQHLAGQEHGKIFGLLATPPFRPCSSQNVVASDLLQTERTHPQQRPGHFSLVRPGTDFVCAYSLYGDDDDDDGGFVFRVSCFVFFLVYWRFHLL